MKFLLVVVAFFISTTGFANDEPRGIQKEGFGHFQFDQMAHLVRAEIDSELVGCGLQFVDPNHPRVSPPRIVADDAIVNASGRLLAYYRSEFLAGYAKFVYSNPDGGLRHQIHFDRRGIEFITPYQGIVARAWRVTNNGGYFHYYYCGNRRVNSSEFAHCVANRLTKIISRQLCRHAG